VLQTLENTIFLKAQTNRAYEFKKAITAYFSFKALSYLCFLLIGLDPIRDTPAVECFGCWVKQRLQAG
jgi:hypothetical protein